MTSGVRRREVGGCLDRGSGGPHSVLTTGDLVVRWRLRGRVVADTARAVLVVTQDCRDHLRKPLNK